MSKLPILAANFPDIVTGIARLRDSKTEKAICYYIHQSKTLGYQSFTSSKYSQLEIKPRALLEAIILYDASEIILMHNHPSGLCYPSSADIYATEKLAYLSTSFSFKLLDHVIVTKNEYFSFQEAGLL